MTSTPGDKVVMIVDDEPSNLDVLGEILRSNHLAVRAFRSGDLALVAAREDPPDLILLDIRMPGMDGYEVCRCLKEDEHLCTIPVIFLSAFTGPTDKLKAFEAGGVDYVTKPFSGVEVLARCHAHLQLRHHQLKLEEMVRSRVAELAEAHRRLRIWDEAKNDWLNVLAHEMRTPLIGVFGTSDLLLQDLPATPENRELRRDYDSSRRRINKLIDDAQTLARIDVSAQGFDQDQVDLGEILGEALDQVEAEDLDVAWAASTTGLDGQAVTASPDLLNRAICDVLRTASYCVNGEEQVHVSGTTDKDRAVITISTEGPSLQVDALETFFEVGGQRALLKGGGDFGLGAALASRIIRLFKGDVSIRNGSERGLAITLSLPIDDPHAS